MKVIGYIRVSTTQQDLARQIDKVKEFCIKKDYTLVRIIKDFGISGATNERKGYKELIKLNSEDCDVVVVSEISRLSRQEEVTPTLSDIQNVLSNGIDLILLDNPDKIYEKNKPLPLQDLLLLIVGLWGAAQERKEIKRKMQDGKMSKFRANPYALVDGVAPYGYRKISNRAGCIPNYLIEENPEEVTIIKKIFELVLSGYTLYAVCAYLNDRNITFRGSLPTVPQLGKYFHNRLYMGERTRTQTYGRTETITHKIRPIISEEDFNKAQELIANNFKYYARSGVNYNPLKGLMRCRCGRAMTVKDKRVEGIKKLTYRCSCNENKNSPNFCIVNIDEVSYNYTIEVVKNVFIQKHQEIKQYIDSKGNERENEVIELIEGIDKKCENNSFKKAEIEKQIKENLDKFLSTSNQTILQALNDRQTQLDKELKDNLSEFDELKRKKAIYQLKLEEIRAAYAKEIDNRIKELDDDELTEIYHTFLEKVEYHAITLMVGFFKLYFKSGQIIYVAITKEHWNPQAYIIDADIDTTTGDITFKYDTVTNGYEIPETKVKTINIKDKYFFKSEWLKYAFATKLGVDFTWRKEFSEQVKAAGGYKDRNARRKKS